MKENHELSILSMPPVCQICGEYWSEHICSCGHGIDRHFFGEEEHCKEADCKCERYETQA